ncbi:MAG: N-ethylammeline chlorohydrolase, partial [Clostridia bacterium]
MRMLLDHLWLFSGVEKNETPTFVLDACVQIVDGEIVYAGARTQAPAFVPDTRIDGAGKLAMPGLANVHTHAPMTLLRG